MSFKHVAVVVADNGERSMRTYGDWSAFIGSDRDAVVSEAVTAAREWTRKAQNGRTYYVLYGTLVSRVETPVMFELVPLKSAPARKAAKKAPTRRKK